ncbi:MAG: glycoside hydrolase family 95 protein [Planctomycetota bacterium]
MLFTQKQEVYTITNQSVLWYKQPATEWNEALPLGNGRLGAMIFGGTDTEMQKTDKISLNEETVWHGAKRDRLNPDTAKHLPEIRKLLLNGKLQEAGELTKMAFTSTPKRQSAYLPAGDLFITYDNHHGGAEEYKRELDLETAVASVSYLQNGIRYKRQHFISYPDQVLVIKIETDTAGKLGLRANLCRQQFEGISGAASSDTVFHNFQAGPDGVKVCMMAKAVTESGKVKTIGDFVDISESTDALIFVAINTDFSGKDPEALCSEKLENASRKGYEALLKDHTEEYRSYYSKTSLTFNADSDNSTLPTDIRLEKAGKKFNDISLIELYFNYSRYLLISCSRPGTQPANLQGIWNDQMVPPWGSKYTININIQMIYWLAEVCNLSECHQPLFDKAAQLCESGRVTAEKLYNCPGFVAHHNSDIFNDTLPTDPGLTAAVWSLGGAWLSIHLWEHFLFSSDRDFLKENAYPIMKEAALFLYKNMFKDQKGRLLSGPSVSPENTFLDKDGIPAAVCLSPAMDREITIELFEAVIEAAGILKEDLSFAEELKAAVKEIPPITIGKHGQIMEWLEDYEEPWPGHRHISHLYSLYPGINFTKEINPELNKAAEQTLKRREQHGSAKGGWSLAWFVLCQARLNQPQEVYNGIQKIIGSSTYPNMLNCQPPFQLDGNMGTAAGIAEMLLQSHAGQIALLPALPAELDSGSVRGLRARSGFELDFSWEDGGIVSVEVRSLAGNYLKVVEYGKEGALLDTATEAGKSYEVNF